MRITYAELPTFYEEMLEIGEFPLVATTFAATAIIFIFIWIKRNGTKDAEKRYPPSSSTLSLVCAIFRGGIGVLPEQFMKSAEKLGPVISYKLGARLVVVLNTKEAISDAFLRKSEAFADRNELWGEVNVFNKNLRGIIFARYNDTFKKYHKLCLTILKEFGFGVNSVSETRILCEVETLIEEILKLNGRPLDPKQLTALSTLKVVSSFLFGKAFVSSSGQKIAEAVIGCTAEHDFVNDFAPFMRFLPYFRRKLALQVQHHKDLISAVEKGIQCSKSTECEPTFVKRFIEVQGPGYDHQDLLYIVRDLCLASAETVSTMLQWAVVELTNHPEVQTLFQKEIDGVVGKYRLPSLEDKTRLPYTEAVILEVMRRHTVLPFYIPHASLKDTELYGFHIPKGCPVFANAVSIHMDPQSWKDPENFRPERFLDEHSKITGSEKVNAFGMGKRSCLGEILGRQQIFLFLTSLVQRFNIRPPEGQDMVPVKEVIGAAMHPSEFKVRLIPRNGDQEQRH